MFGKHGRDLQSDGGALVCSCGHIRPITGGCLYR